MKVAFATQDRQRIDAHFGWARNLAIYDVRPEDKLAPKLEAIADCAILYVAAIGGSGAARVVAQKIHPIKVPQPEPILDVLDKLQAVLRGTPPPWLRKALAKGRHADPHRFEDEDEATHD